MDRATELALSALIFTHPNKPALIESLKIGALRCKQENDPKGARQLMGLIEVTEHYLEEDKN